MKPAWSVLAGMLLAASASALQDLPFSLEAFEAASAETKRGALAKIALHSVQLPPADVVALIRAGLLDADHKVRRQALNAVTSHAAGQRFLTRADQQSLHDRVREAWLNERPLMGELRPPVLAALLDPNPGLRRDAVMALVNMDFDPEQREPTPGEQTVSDLAALYRRESEAFVRDEIVKSFALGSADYPELRRVLLDALDDPNQHVRQHALMGAERLQLQEALPKAVKALRDPDGHVRFLAAKALGAYCATKDCVTALNEALATEKDETARGKMDRAITTIRER